MSLLTNLVTQITQGAFQGQNQTTNMNNNPMQNNGNLGGMFGGQAPSQTGGLGNIFGNVLGGNLGGLGANMGGLNNMSQGGMLGQVLGSVLGGGMGGGFGYPNMSNNQRGFNNRSMLMAALLPLVLMFIQRNGGIAGALDRIKHLGLGQQANSWISATDNNQQLDTSNVAQLFDEQDINQVAAQTGADSQEIGQGLAELLPQVVDHLTPNGDIQNQAEADSEINDILAQLNLSHLNGFTK